MFPLVGALEEIDCQGRLSPSGAENRDNISLLGGQFGKTDFLAFTVNNQNVVIG